MPDTAFVPVRVDGGVATSSDPVSVLGDHACASLSAAQFHTCGLAAVGEVYCWGDNFYGQLGDGTRTDPGQPVRVTTSLRFVDITTGRYHTCGVTADGAAYCWGDNGHSRQLGSGQFDRACPVAECSPLPSAFPIHSRGTLRPEGSALMPIRRKA